MSHILIAHAPEDERAALVAEKLTGLGFEVRQDDDAYRALSPLERRKLAASIAEASCVVVLWSREAAGAAALQAAAQAAKAQGKLTLARLDASTPPPRMSSASVVNLAQWQGLEEARGWKDLVGAVKAKTKPSSKDKVPTAKTTTRPAAATKAASEPAKKKGGASGLLAVLFVLAAIGGGIYYASSHGLIPH